MIIPRPFYYLGLLFLILLGFGYWYISSQADKWELRFKILEDENKTLKDDAKVLAQIKADLTRQADDLNKQVIEIRKQKAQQIEVVWKMPTPQVATTTAQEIHVPPTDVVAKPTDEVCFTQEAAKQNLVALIAGRTAADELKVATEQVANCRAQVDNCEKSKVIVQKQLEQSQVEVKMEKSKSKKHTIWAVLGGLAAGVVVGVVAR